MREYEFYYTQDGSVGLYSYADNDVYHSKFGALTEAWEKFILPSELENKLNKKPEIRVLDVCYGIGYNTKALMSYVLNENEKFLVQKNIFQKILEKLKIFIKKNNFKIKKFAKKFFLRNYIDTIDSDNITPDNKILSPSTEAIDNNKIISHIQIDCLEINEELVKISPLLKTIIQPKEIFNLLFPEFIKKLNVYKKIKKLLMKYSIISKHKNKQEITELLDLKFSNDYDEINNEYKIHKFVNYIIADNLIEKFKEEYLTKNLCESINQRSKKDFFDRFLLTYVKSKQKNRYYLSNLLFLAAFLHNIYYTYLSKRYKKVKYKLASELFKLNFYIQDARKTILEINGQYDLIFMDAFTYSKAPELWSKEFIAEIYNHLSQDGIVMTYSNSALVRNTFLENNFYVGKIYDSNTGKYIGTVAAKNKSIIKHPLNNFEIGLCATKAGIPYRDPSLNFDKEQILKQRELEFNNSNLISSSLYMKKRKQRSTNDK